MAGASGMGFPDTSRREPMRGMEGMRGMEATEELIASDSAPCSRPDSSRPRDAGTEESRGVRNCSIGTTNGPPLGTGLVRVTGSTSIGIEAMAVLGVQTVLLTP